MNDTPDGMTSGAGAPPPASGLLRLLAQGFGLGLVLVGVYYGLGILGTVLGFLRDPDSLRAPAEAMAVVLGLERATVPVGDADLPVGRAAGMIALLLWYALASLIVWKVIQVGGVLAVATFNERREFYGAIREMLLALRREKEEAARGGG